MWDIINTLECIPGVFSKQQTANVIWPEAGEAVSVWVSVDFSNIAEQKQQEEFWKLGDAAFSVEAF